MASSTSTTLSISSSSTLIDGKAAPRPLAGGSAQCVTLPPPPLPRPQNRDTWKSAAYCRKIVRNVVAMAAGDAPAMTTGEAPAMTTGDAPAEVAPTEMPEMPEVTEIAKTIQEAWDKTDDKYAVTSLAFAVAIALWGSTGLISAIERLPLVPGILELVGIGYTGWFAYKNLVFKPDREILFQKIKDTYKDITGSS